LRKETFPKSLNPAASEGIKRVLKVSALQRWG
jgi:hypothetical protein